MSAQLAVLGLLAEGPAHGYALERLIEERGMRKWASIGSSSIYYVLGRMVSGGLADVDVVAAPGRGPRRKVHTITRRGRSVWEGRAIDAITDTDAPAEEFLLAIAGFPLLDPAKAGAALECRVSELDARIESLAADRREAAPFPGHVEAMFDLTLARLVTDRTWTQSFLQGQYDQPSPQRKEETP